MNTQSSPSLQVKLVFSIEQGLHSFHKFLQGNSAPFLISSLCPFYAARIKMNKLLTREVGNAPHPGIVSLHPATLQNRSPSPSPGTLPALADAERRWLAVAPGRLHICKKDAVSMGCATRTFFSRTYAGLPLWSRISWSLSLCCWSCCVLCLFFIANTCARSVGCWRRFVLFFCWCRTCWLM